MTTDFNKYNNSWYQPSGTLKRGLWFLVNVFFFNNGLAGFNKLKLLLLKAFGASVGTGVVIKPSVNIKYPWFLTIGNNVWIGEAVWIDNLTHVIIGNNVCLSQGAMLLTGNHNYSKQSFDLIIGEIKLEDGVWIGAKAIVCPGITCYSHSVLAAASVANKSLEAYSIYQGNPAVKVRVRKIGHL
ncbi:WcaF family extracellular polysaccharide biosynthesis acetyltransferase [Parasediminibacterium sp. JCM 36343]|uniref:WcaF family extracellular polysaccharide biosynthesis acetyltransferase n=1 Tax=Parasediminibacterium sp. JCM 36343 TaxID=3374279 RepID=UPI00397909DA